MTTSDRPQVTLTCLDLQPIDPPIGGGRARLLGLYHALGARIRATYVGSYDWRGPGYRRHMLSGSLEEIDVPLPEEVFAVHDRWRSLAGDRTVIDVLFPLLASRAEAFISTAARWASASDIVVFSHPWVFPLVSDVVDQTKQLIVYDSQNVEGVMRGQLFDGSALGTQITRYIAITEAQLLALSDVVLACSDEDRRLFSAIYDTDTSKIIVVPNGVFVSRVRPTEDREGERRAFGLRRPVCVFVGSAYGPNIEGVRFIRDHLAFALPEVTFAICGNVCEVFVGERMPDNVRLLGVLEERERLELLAAADVAVNPIFAGSGTNLKMFDFFAAGLPTVTTPVGARGIGEGAGSAFIVTEAGSIARVLTELIPDRDRLARMGAEARALAERSFSWEKISPQLGDHLLEALSSKRSGPMAPRKVDLARRAECPTIAVLIGRQDEIPAAAELDARVAELLPRHRLETLVFREGDDDALKASDVVVLLGSPDPAQMELALLCGRPIVAGSPASADEHDGDLFLVEDSNSATLALGIVNVLADHSRRR